MPLHISFPNKAIPASRGPPRPHAPYIRTRPSTFGVYVQTKLLSPLYEFFVGTYIVAYNLMIGVKKWKIPLAYQFDPTPEDARMVSGKHAQVLPFNEPELEIVFSGRVRPAMIELLLKNGATEMTVPICHLQENKDLLSQPYMAV